MKKLRKVLESIYSPAKLGAARDRLRDLRIKEEKWRLAVAETRANIAALEEAAQGDSALAVFVRGELARQRAELSRLEGNVRRAMSETAEEESFLALAQEARRLANADPA